MCIRCTRHAGLEWDRYIRLCEENVYVSIQSASRSGEEESLLSARGFEAVVKEKLPPSATGALPGFRRGVLASALFAGGAVCLGSFLAFTLAALNKDVPIDTAAAPYTVACALLLVLAFTARGYWYDNVTIPDLRGRGVKRSESAYLFLRKRRNYGVGESRG